MTAASRNAATNVEYAKDCCYSGILLRLKNDPNESNSSMTRPIRDLHEYLPTVVDDGRETANVGEWAFQKYLRVGMYDQLVATGMKDQFDERVYLDLYSGSGHARVRGRGVHAGSPLLALSVTHPFDKYIFCDADPKNISALQARVDTRFPNAKCVYVSGDANERVREIISHIPVDHYPQHKVLTFCFVDPFSLNIDFETIRKLASGRRIDFLILLAIGMDANRNWQNLYWDRRNSRMEKFLGDPEWRNRYIAGGFGNVSSFILQQYTSQMQSIGYKAPPKKVQQFYLVRAGHVKLYYLGFFSKHERGYQYWGQVSKYSADQSSLDFG